MATGILLTVALFASTAIGTTTAFLAWRERPEPGSVSLVVLLAGQSWWSTCLIFQLQATTLAAKLFWVNLSWIGVVVTPVAWFLFCLEYTGQDEYVTRQSVGTLAVIPAITVLLAMTGGMHHLLYLDSTLVTRDGVLRLAQTPGVWFWVIGAYTYLLGLLGAIPLLGLVTSDATTFRGQSTALLVGLVAPWVSNALYLAGVIPTGSLDPTPIAFSITGVAFLFALTRFRLLGTSPAPNKRARRVIFDRMQEGAVVVDNHDYIVDMNDSAAGILGVEAGEALGMPAAGVVPEFDHLPERGTLDGHLTVGENPYDATVTQISNARDRPIGRVVTFHDVSTYLRQQERLRVLNRVLRHNIRTETNIIQGYVDRMASADEEAEIVRTHVHRIADIGEKGRDAISLFDDMPGGHDPHSLDALLSSAVSAVSDAYPEVAVDYEPASSDLAVASLLDTVFVNVVENAAEHNSSAAPRVAITVEPLGEEVRVRVADNGPGITDYERAVLEEGDETSLRHGSGLGLWIAKWGVDIADGDITFTENDGGGTLVTIDVPALDPDPTVEPTVRPTRQQ